MEALITLKDVGLYYKQSGALFAPKKTHVALKSISFELYRGETLGILGRNGAGKSTLLRVLSGVLKPDAGTITNHGASISLLSLQAGFNMNLCGRDNAIISSMLQGRDCRLTDAELADICEYAELGKFFDMPVRTYSTGMRARLGFAISNLLSPDILLIDEVLSVGDAEFKKKAERTMMAKILSDQTVVLVSHSEEQIKRLCDRVLVLEDGIVVASGDPEEALSSRDLY
jgi:lipopolysaccharide transport system ATP-binding protein